MPYFFKRLLAAVPLLFCICFLSFLLMHLAPGDPTIMFMDPSVSVHDLDQVKRNLGLDKPLLVQFLYWMKRLFQGDLGYSFVTGQSVTQAIFNRLPATLYLSISSLFLILVITFPLGLLSAYKKGSRFDNFVTIFTFTGLAIPTFWLGLVLILFFSIQLNWFPTSGFIDPFLISAPWYEKLMNVSWHIVLPLLTIIIGGIAGLTRYNRFSVLQILNQDYIKAARARGLSEKRILFKHSFKNAALPVITILGMDLSSLISGSYIIEYIFSWPGMGQLGVSSVFSRDYPILMGMILFSSILIILGNLLADVAYQFIDPRVKS